MLIKDTLEERLVTLVAWEDDRVVGYATFNRASARYGHVAQLRVVVGQSARGIGIGRLLLELAFEMVLDMGVTKVIARMTPEQTMRGNCSSDWALPRKRSCGIMPGTQTEYPRSAGPQLSHPPPASNVASCVGLRVLRCLSWTAPGSARIVTNPATASWAAASRSVIASTDAGSMEGALRS